MQPLISSLNPPSRCTQGDELPDQFPVRRFQPFGACLLPHPPTPHTLSVFPIPMAAPSHTSELRPRARLGSTEGSGQHHRPRAVVEAAGNLLSLSAAWIGCSEPLEVGLCVGQPIRGAVPCFSSPLSTEDSAHGRRRWDGGLAVVRGAGLPQHLGWTRWQREAVALHILLNPCNGSKAAIGRTGKRHTHRGEGTNHHDSQGRASSLPLKPIFSQTPS